MNSSLSGAAGPTASGEQKFPAKAFLLQMAAPYERGHAIFLWRR
jgi:hypothetical protein